ncbi:tripartite tricarboxylate transporter permease [Mesorhizobium sp.]|uniref:tripartite tricarboxylate transporter permease n=1 Tax=Mesorhizobium sp. TaxID=1871066 RepID=UPI0025EED356|nr:tripartite tricarboxylate transporter permease [Mesorhizobium sp.]
MQGLVAALSYANLLYCLSGALIGTLIGVLPGLGPTATLAILLPITYQLPADSALIMLAGIYYGAQYGGSTTSILMNLPGEASSVVTALDGHHMARDGRAGVALGIAAIGSFVAGTAATVVIAVLSPPLAALAQKFGAPEYFALMVLGLVAAVALASGPILKSLAAIFLGLFLGLVGTDVSSDAQRFTFGFLQLAEGIDFTVIAMGLFGVSEVIIALERPEARSLATSKIDRIFPNREELREAWPAIARGTGIGTILGILPGGGAILASFASYAVEKRMSRRPERFGHGEIAGVAGPEAANNSGAQMSFVPLLTLGIPANSVMALMLGLMTVKGIIPGPKVIEEQALLFWSMWIGNAMLLVINLPLVGLWARLVMVPYARLFPAILLTCCVGVYSVGLQSFDVLLMSVFALLGYLLRKLGCEPAPLLLGFILGPLLEENLRRTLLLSGGNPAAFLGSGISVTLLGLALALLISLMLPSLRSKRNAAFVE